MGKASWNNVPKMRSTDLWREGRREICSHGQPARTPVWCSDSHIRLKGTKLSLSLSFWLGKWSGLTPWEDAQWHRLKRLGQEVHVLHSSCYHPAGLLEWRDCICTYIPVTTHPPCSSLQVYLKLIWIINLPTFYNIFSLCLNEKQIFFSDGLIVFYSLVVFLDWAESTF